MYYPIGQISTAPFAPTVTTTDMSPYQAQATSKSAFVSPETAPAPIEPAPAPAEPTVPTEPTEMSEPDGTGSMLMWGGLILLVALAGGAAYVYSKKKR
jgi:hypothetical protein